MTFFDIASYFNESEAVPYAAGEQVFAAGDVGGEMYFILAGEVQITVDDRELDYLLPGQIFGEMALVDNQVRSATATVVSAGKLVAIDKALFATLTRQIPQFAIDVMAVMSNRLRRYMEDEVGRLRLQEEIKIGQKMQLSLLPERCPEIAGWAFAANYLAARQVGGDFYDIIDDPDNPDLLHLVIADVTGKGVPAALFMAVCRTIIRTEAQNGRSPADLLMRTNQQLKSEKRSLPFLSAFFGTLHLPTGRLVYAIAGHDRPYWMQASNGQIQQIEGKGLLLGAFPLLRLEEYELTLAEGDSLILYTDGITEARAGAGFFDESRLEAVLARNRGASAAKLVEAILQAVDEFTHSQPQSDDMTLMIVQRKES